MDTKKLDHAAHPVRMVAHRGVSGLETENTCAAFVAAGNRSYYGVETDVHISADGKFIISHDGNTLRIGQEEHIIEQTDSAVLRALTLADCDGWEKTRSDLKLPILSEYIRICRKYEKHCVLELKGEISAETLAEMVQEIRELGWLEQVTFISFVHENLEKVRALLPRQPMQFLTDLPADEALLEQLLPWGFGLDIYYRSLTKEGLDLMHANGVEVNCWTVDDVADAARLADWGVDYITSNIVE